MKKLFSILAIILCIIHAVIFYFWLVEWEKLVTVTGIFIWLGSIVAGLLMLIGYQISRKKKTEKWSSLNKVILISTSSMIFILILSVLIEIALSSMP